jgi:hypothetical protein
VGQSGGRAALTAVVGALGLVALAWIYTTPLVSPPIRSDGTGYYLYLPAALIDHDLTLERTFARSFGGGVPDWAGIHRAPGTGRYFIKYPIGEAVLIAPFFLVAHAVTLFSGGRADGFSSAYQIAAAIAGLTYVTLGVWILWGVLARSFSTRVVAWTLGVIVFGTNLFHYATYDGIFSHAFSFFLFALFLASAEQWRKRLDLRSTIAMAIVAGLITLVRPTNSLVFVYAFAGDVPEWWARLRRRADVGRMIAIGAATYFAVMLPQLAYWKYTTGHWLFFSYVGETFDFAHPKLVEVLFSVRKGLFVWAPVLVLAVAGFGLLRHYARGWTIPTLIFLPLQIWLVASWHDWAYGAGFGHRAFVESAVILAFGYASLLESAVAAGRQSWVIAVSIVLTLVCVRLMLQYWLGVIPIDHTTWPDYWAALWSAP